MNTLEEYKQYVDSVAQFISREGISFLSTSTAETCGGQEQEPWFSWYPCQCCKRQLGGDREYLYARDKANEIVRFTICTDCVYYIEYGRLDDITMQHILTSRGGL